MSDEDKQEPDEAAARRKKITVEYIGSQQQAELDAKFAKLRLLAGDASKAHSEKFAKFFKEPPRVPALNMTELLSNSDLAPKVDPKSMPGYRAAAAAEATEQHLDTLVNAALKAAEDAERRDRAIEQREMKVDRRENWVLGSTIVGVVLAGIAAFGPVDLSSLLGWASDLFQ